MEGYESLAHLYEPTIATSLHASATFGSILYRVRNIIDLV